jgi:hypothetical protein
VKDAASFSDNVESQLWVTEVATGGSKSTVVKQDFEKKNLTTNPTKPLLFYGFLDPLMKYVIAIIQV